MRTQQIADLIIALGQEEKLWVDQLKLHKVLYFVQGWSLATRDSRLFDEGFKAWREGPVVTSMRKYKGYGIQPLPCNGMPEDMPEDVREFVVSVWDSVKHKSGTELANEAKQAPDSPWRVARAGLRDDVDCNKPIDDDLIRRQFVSLQSEIDTVSDSIIRELGL